MCIDAQCQKGHDSRAEVRVRGWTSDRAVIHSEYGDVPARRSGGADRMAWSGRNGQGQTETLSLRRADMRFTYVVQLEATSVVQKLTARGRCVVAE